MTIQQLRQRIIHAVLSGAPVPQVCYLTRLSEGYLMSSINMLWPEAKAGNSLKRLQGYLYKTLRCVKCGELVREELASDASMKERIVEAVLSGESMPSFAKRHNMRLSAVWTEIDHCWPAAQQRLRALRAMLYREFKCAACSHRVSHAC